MFSSKENLLEGVEKENDQQGLSLIFLHPYVESLSYKFCSEVPGLYSFVKI